MEGQKKCRQTETFIQDKFSTASVWPAGPSVLVLDGSAVSGLCGLCTLSMGNNYQAVGRKSIILVNSTLMFGQHLAETTFSSVDYFNT